MAYNHINSNLCNNTDIILEKYKAMRAEQKYLSGTSLSGGVKKDTVEKNSNTKNTVEDGNDDGKISFKEKVKNFGKGLIAPVKNMFSSPKNIAITVASTAAGIGLIALTGGAAAPVMVAAGIIGGGIQIGRGIYKQVKAVSDEEAKQAWQQIGSGTFTAGVSAAGAKSALKVSGTETKGMSVLSAIGKCFKDSPKNIAKSGSSIASKFSSASKAVSQALKPSAKTDTGASRNIEIIEGEVITDPKGQSKTVNNVPKDYIDAEFYEVVEEPDISAVQSKLTGKKEPLQISAKAEKAKISAKSEPLGLPEGQKRLLLEAHNSDTAQKASLLQKVKNLLKVFGFFKPEE